MFVKTHSGNKTTLIVLLFVLATVILLASTARADALSFQSYTQRDGLADDYITQIAFAPDGSAWIGTARGATRVQDKYWITYTSENGLGNSWVSGIAVGSDGKVYFATNGGGLSIFDGAARKTLNTSNSAIPSNYLTGVTIDKQNHLWVSTYGAGVARLDGDKWTKFTLPTNFVNALAIDSSGNPWVATNDGAFFLDVSKPGPSVPNAWKQFTQSKGLASNRVNALAVAPDSKIWFATDNGLTVYNGATFRSYNVADGLASNSTQAIAVDAQGRVWICTGRGLSVLDAGKWKTYNRVDGLADDLVVALALDARGNPWVGTSHGLSTFGSATLSRPTTLPVVLVHGWHTADSDQIDDTEFRFIKNYMQQDGINVFYAAGISPYHTLFQNAATLRDDIARVKAQTGAPRVDILAFSMGGLNTRAYLESTYYQSDVRRAIILGTPQAGVRLWYPLLTREIQDRPTEPSVIELTPEYAALFNRTHAPRATVPYDLLVGNAQTQPGLELLKIFPPSDGLIDEWSAHALTGPLVRHVVDTDVHAWDPAPVPFNISSYLYPAQTYERFIRNALRDPDSRPIGFAAPPVAPIAPRNITPLNVDSLRTGETITRSVVIDANRAARFFARWNTGDFDLALRAPDGTRYTPNNFRDATYLKADIGSFSGYSIPSAQAGNWLVSATRLDTGTSPLTVTTYADLDADLKLSAETDAAWYPLGAPVVINASLSNSVSGADVRASIEWLGDGVSPRGVSNDVRLLEEGELGTYANTIAGLKRGGYYLVHITARSSGFAREQQLIFAMSPQTAAFAGAPRAHVQGVAASYSALIVDTSVNATRAGAFALSATLHDAKGQLVSALTEPITLTTGTQAVSIS
ncbi:MAG TPA: two-component regulator propeller domain-containing protein, partial [Anaerolineae bacterium]